MTAPTSALSSGLPKRIRSRADLARAVGALLERDPSLEPVARAAGPLPLRLGTPGFAGMVEILVGQQVSIASANAIWARLSEGLGAVTPEAVLARDEEALRGLGLSRPKARYAHALAEAVAAGQIDFARLARAADAEVVETLTAVKGIGPWSAEIYLLFCLGRVDVWPALDLALQESLRIAYGYEGRPRPQDCLDRAEAWRPLRGVAARLFWAYYKAVKGR